LKYKINNILELNKVIKCIKKSNNKIIILNGTLGSGKTTLVKNFVKSLGLKDEVTSPTFSLQNVYENIVFHYDLYNKGINEFLSLGLLEELEKNGYHFIEWGEKLENILKNFGFKYLKINIKVYGNLRIYECQN
jgi:tRNA threonylcarbamoyladenosine biosynthesis protein TsaE